MAHRFLPRFLVTWADGVRRIIHARTVWDARELAIRLSSVDVAAIRRLQDGDEIPT